jgi:hypothetical protein
VVREGVGQCGEMNQALYAHMNNKRKMKKKKKKKDLVNEASQQIQSGHKRLEVDIWCTNTKRVRKGKQDEPTIEFWSTSYI